VSRTGTADLIIRGLRQSDLLHFLPGVDHREPGRRGQFEVPRHGQHEILGRKQDGGTGGRRRVTGHRDVRGRIPPDTRSQPHLAPHSPSASLVVDRPLPAFRPGMHGG
jgi:hypothetical protein